jgi:hypothetical protein
VSTTATDAAKKTKIPEDEKIDPDGGNPPRILAFARFFKRYMSVSAVVVAALPIPIAELGAIPIFASQKAELATYTSLLCFLLLSYVFYMRHSIASALFLHRHRRLRVARLIDGLPLILIVGCIGSIFGYQALLINSVGSAEVAEAGFQAMQFQQMQKQLAPAGTMASVGSTPPEQPLWGTNEGHRRLTMEFILTSKEQHTIKNDTALMLVYLSIFLCAEGAFVLMALREYLQEALKLSERDVIEQISAPALE